MTVDVSCLRGSWEGGICVCDPGYITEFTVNKLYPIYCGEEDKEFVVNLVQGFEPIDFLHYATLSLTVGGATASVLWFAFFLYTILDTRLLKRKIKRAELKLEEFKKKQVRRDSTENLNAELWYPDLETYKCVNGFAEEAEKKEKILYAKVLHAYKPQAAGELRLRTGDTIKNVVRLEKGWCKGTLNGKTGFYPEAYAEKFEPTESDLEETPTSGESDQPERKNTELLEVAEPDTVDTST